MKVKNSAITYTGYDYQTLHGVRLLAEWLKTPSKYIRATFEADQSGDETPSGIDDVVFQKPDGVYDYWQVKFTPTPDKPENGLTWDWLLKKSGKTERSRSILKKIFDAVNKVPQDKLGEVILLTNKRPDRAIETCIYSSTIQFEKIALSTQEEIILQLGSKEAAAQFFSKLTVQHSSGDYHFVKRTITSELIKFSNDAGVERLLSKSREWAMFKNNPPSDGWIHLHHIREILSKTRPDPIPELFTIPNDYCLPNADFHNSLLDDILKSRGEIITLTGKPGAGKSTYLSYLCDSLEDKKIPLIRHHYFLALNDTTEDRLSPRIVSESLLHQIDTLHKDVGADTSKPEKLRDALTSCADFYKQHDKPFIVFIDGLDHVWRDNAKNKSPLDETFRQLLPAIDNCTLIVGTQPVDDDLLPKTLVTFSPKNTWKWLPEMSGNSIYEYLKLQVESNRLFLNCHESQSEEVIRESADKLFSITNGYPLHVIYSTEYLSHQATPLSSWAIEQLPPCADGNISTYYAELWRSLTYKQKDALHLCSGFPFAWPRKAIGQIVNDQYDDSPSINAVAHLLSEGTTGVTPFHESLVVFIRDQLDHESQIDVLLPSVCYWLEHEAPNYLKDNWLWSSQARAGDSTNLREGLSRDWILDRLIAGVSLKQCNRLLTEAETYAFEDGEYAEAYRHRALKTRLLNGPEFQTWDRPSLDIFSLIKADQLALDDKAASSHEASSIQLSILATNFWYRGEYENAQFYAAKAINRYRAKTKLLSSRHSQDDESETTMLIKANVLTDSFDYESIFRKDNFSSWSDGCINSFRTACCMKSDLDLLLRARENLADDSHHARQFELDAFRLSVIEEADITCRPEYEALHQRPLIKFGKAFDDANFSDVVAYHIHDQTTDFKIETTDTYHDWFFSSLIFKLSAAANFTWIPVKAESDRADISIHYDLLNNLAEYVSDLILHVGNAKFDSVSALLPIHPILDQVQWETRNADIQLKRAWIEIAADCHLVTTKGVIEYDELHNSIDIGVYQSLWLRLWYKELEIKLLSESAAEYLIQIESERLSIELEETIEKSNGFLELAQISLFHGNVRSFEHTLRMTWDFVLGYGHHKDPTIFDVLTATKYLSSIDKEASLTILKRISPVIANISEFTDGDETRHSKPTLSSLLAKLNPQTAASIYEQEMKSGEWYSSEETVRSLLKEGNLSTPIVKSLYLSGLHDTCYNLLKGCIENNEPEAHEVKSQIENLIGESFESLENEKRPQTSEFDEKITLKPEDYPPSKIEELIKDLDGQISAKRFWVTWYKYWVKEGHEPELVNTLLPYCQKLQDSFDDKRYLLDLMFSGQKKIRGKKKAFELLVVAHQVMNGWADWYESTEASLNRLEIITNQYPNRIDEFITSTTTQSDRWNNKQGNLVIPSDKLVYLQACSGNAEEALELTLAMVESLEESVRNLKLPIPNWDWQTHDSINNALTKCLVSRLKEPVPTIKIWVVEQIADLLSNEHEALEDILLTDLANRQLESECIEVLCVFLVAKYKGYIPPSNLGKYIKARSVLSDLILDHLLIEPSEQGTHTHPISPFLDIEGDNNRFEYFQGSHVPRLYLSWLETMEKSTGLPLPDYYQSEWNRTFEYEPGFATDIQFFLSGSHQRSTGQFYTQASHRGRSAYLRTLQLAKQYFGMPDEYAENISIPVLPIEPAYVGLKPRTPAWIPTWNNSKKPNAHELTQYAKEVLDSFKAQEQAIELLSASYPIKIDENNWIDFTIVKAKTKGELPKTVEIQERSSCLSVGNLLENTLSFECSDNGSDPFFLTTIPYPYMRYGHWHSDLESRGIHVPICSIDDVTITASPKEGVLIFAANGTMIGHASFWNNHWKPIHPIGIRSLCGTYTVANQESTSEWRDDSESLKSIYIINATVLTSEHSYGEYSSKEYAFHVTTE